MRQGISLILSQSFDQVWTFSLSSLHICLIHHYVVHYMHNKDSTLDTQRKVSEDPKDFAFLRIIQSLAFYCIQVSSFPRVSQRCWFPADCPISCIFTVYKAHTMHTCASIYPKDFAFLRIIQSLAFYCIQVSRFTHISQRSWFPADCPISCILLYTSIKVPAYMPKILVCIVQSFLVYTSIKSSKEFPAYSWVALFSYEKRRQYLP